jgi:hypothetical protein
VDYTIIIDSVDFDFRSYNFMKIGQLYRSSLAPGEKRSYKFILEDDFDLTLIQTMSEGANVSSSLKKDKFGDSIIELKNTDSKVLKKTDQ